MRNPFIALLPLSFALTILALPAANDLDGSALQARDTSAHPATCTTMIAHASTPTISASTLLDKAIKALGGKNALSALKGVQWDAYIYRSQTDMESITPGYADNTIATTGTSLISYDLSGDVTDIKRRDDRFYQVSEYWYFGRGLLQPINASLVTRGGPSGYGCYVRGNEGVYQPTDQVGGYTDPAYTNVLVRDATRLSPKLLLMMQANTKHITASTIQVRKNSYPALTDNKLNLTVLLDPVTYLPYSIRAYEDHHIYGMSANDLVVYNYTTVAGVQLPQRIKIMYNEENMLLDMLTYPPKANPKFEPGYFDGIPLSQVKNTEFGFSPAPAAKSDVYGEAEVFEFSMNMLWYAGYFGKLSNITVTHPMPNLPLTHIIFNDAPGYAALIAEFEDGVMVVDSPPHQSLLVIEWVKQNLKKPITHLLVTHHHHDHNYGAKDYVAIGATMVIPKDFKYYWETIPGAKFALVTEETPFIHKDAHLQVRCVWNSKNAHANDWMYFTWTERCPGPDSRMAVTVADPWSPGLVGYEFNQWDAISYLDVVRKNRMPRDNLVIPLHGVPTNATELYNLTAYSYPDFKTTDFLPGGPWC